MQLFCRSQQEVCLEGKMFFKIQSNIGEFFNFFRSFSLFGSEALENRSQSGIKSIEVAVRGRNSVRNVS